MLASFVGAGAALARPAGLRAVLIHRLAAALWLADGAHGLIERALDLPRPAVAERAGRIVDHVDHHSITAEPQRDLSAIEVDRQPLDGPRRCLLAAFGLDVVGVDTGWVAAGAVGVVVVTAL